MQAISSKYHLKAVGEAPSITIQCTLNARHFCLNTPSAKIDRFIGSDLPSSPNYGGCQALRTPFFTKQVTLKLFFWNLGQELLNTIPNPFPIHLKSNLGECLQYDSILRNNSTLILYSMLSQPSNRGHKLISSNNQVTSSPMPIYKS